MDTAIRPTAGTNFPLPSADLESLGFRKSQIDRLIALIASLVLPLLVGLGIILVSIAELAQR